MAEMFSERSDTLVAYGFDEQPGLQVNLRDKQARCIKFYHFNTFGEYQSESINNVDYPILQQYDTSGNIWSSNKSGSPTINLYDLAGNPTLTMQAPDINLSDYAYTQLPELINDRNKVERTEKIYDINGNMSAIKAPYWDEKNVNGLPTHRYEYDRWRNLLEEYDSMDHNTSHAYNHHNQEIFTFEPETTAISEINTSIRLRPWTKYSHNEMGQLTAKTNTYSFTEGYYRDNTGQLMLKMLPDGTKAESNIIDIFGNIKQSFTARNYSPNYYYNRLNQLKLTVEPGGRNKYYDYDTAHNRTLTTDSFGCFYRANYLNGAPIARYQPLGDMTTYVNDHNGLVINETRPYLKGKNWQRNYWGQVENYYDLSFSRTHYDYNYKKEKIGEQVFNAPGNPHGDKLKINSDVKFTAREDADLRQFPIVDHFPVEYPDAPANVSYRYRKGLLEEVIDGAYGKTTKYEHDSEGRRTHVTVTEGKDLLKDTQQLYDELGRDEQTIDKLKTATNYYSTLTKNQAYDAVNNRRYTAYLLDPAGYALNCHAPKQEWYNWFTYDEADRVLYTQASLGAHTEPVLTKGKGALFSYKNDLRDKEITLLPNGWSTVNLYYDEEDYLHRSASYAYTAERAQHHYALTSYLETFISPENGKWINTGSYTFTDQNGREKSNKYFEGTTNKSSTTKQYMPLWDVCNNQTTVQLGDKNQLIYNNYYIDYNFFDEPLLTYAKGFRTERGKTTHGDSFMFHYPNGMANGKILAADEHNYEVKAAQPKVFFDATHDGILMSKRLVRSPVDQFPPYTYHRADAYTKGYYYFTDVNNNFLGQYAELFNPNANIQSYNHGLFPNHRYIHQSGYPCGVYPTISDVTFPEFPQPVGRTKASPKPSSDNPPGLLDGPLIPPKQTVYFTKHGDTFASIAKDHCGDSEFGEKIARKNGFFAEQPLKAGMAIFIPQYIASKNKAENKNRLNKFISIIQGSILPFIPNPPPKENKQDYLKIIAKIIAVAIAVYAAGLMAPYLLPYITHMGIPMTTEALTGVLAAINEAGAQGLAIVGGTQDKFSVQEALETGVTAGFGGFAMDNLKSAKLALQLKGVLEIAAVSVGTQLTEMGLGLRDKFDAGAVAIQVAGAYAGAKIDQGLNYKLGDSKLTRPLSTAAKTVTGAGLGKAINNTPIDVQLIAAQAVGSSIADEVTERADTKLRQNRKEEGATQRSNERSYIKERERAHENSHSFANTPFNEFNLSQSININKIEQSPLSRMSMWNRESERSTTFPTRAWSDLTEHYSATQTSLENIKAQTQAMEIPTQELSFTDKAERIAKAAVRGVKNAGVGIYNEFTHAFDPAYKAEKMLGGLLTATEFAQTRPFSFERTEMLAELGAPILLAAVVTKGSSLLQRMSFLNRAGGERVANQILHHSKIKFSQSSVNNVETITESMMKDGWKGAPIDVVKLEDGTLVTVDNTRLLAASRADIPVRANVYNFDKPLSAEMAERFTTKQGGVPITWGEAVENRIKNQNNLYRDKYPYGSRITGAR